MKVLLFAPVNDEKLCLDIQLKEGNSWIDEIHVTEFDRTFQGKYKGFYLKDTIQHSKLFVHSIEGKSLFKYNKFYKFFGVFAFGKNVFSNSIKNRFNRVRSSWYNEAIQRNKSSDYGNIIADDDIVILSDIDEIIDSQYAEEIINEVKKRGVITIKMHFSLFYFNLFSVNWGGPEQYSYRTFIMTGEYFKNMKCSSDYLRKQGEGKLLLDKIFCPDTVMGFHHSWLGDENFISNKLSAYAHSEHSHLNNMDYIRDCLKNNKSIFKGHDLRKDDSINLLSCVKDLKDTFPQYFI